MNKPSIGRYGGLLFLLTASLLLSLQYIPAFNPLNGDKEVYRYIARVMLKGGVPYRDVFDHKPPLIYFLNCLALLLGGDWGQWVIDTALAMLVTALFYRLCKRYRLPYPWLLPLLFNLMIRNHLICWGMGMTREYTTMFLLLFFGTMMEKHRYRYFFLGGISGLIFFMQQDQVIALVPLFLYILLDREDPASFWRRLLPIATGFLLIALPIVGYFAFHQASGYLWQDAFRFNYAWYTTTLKETAWDHWRAVKASLDQGNYELPAIVALTLGVAALFFPHDKKRLLLLSLVAALLSVSTEFMGGRNVQPYIYDTGFSHYYLALSASLPILLFCVFAFTREPVLQGFRAQGIFGFLLCASLAYTSIQHGLNHRPLRENPVVASPEMNYLRQHRPVDYQLFVFFDNSYTYAYNEFGIVGPSRWLFQNFWQLYDSWDRDHALLRTIEQDLLQHHTKYVLNFAGTATLFRDPMAFAEWKSFLSSYYQQVTLTGSHDGELWILKGEPG